MKFAKNLGILLIVGFLLSGGVGGGTGLPSLHIDELLNQSEVVVVADVSGIKAIGPAAAAVGGAVVPGQLYRAEAVALYWLSGTCPDQFVVEFVLPDKPVGYKSIKPGPRMLFLRRSGTNYGPTNPFYPDFPAIRSEPADLAGKETIDRVFGELAAVIASAEAPSGDKWEVLQQSFAIPDNNTSFLDHLHVGLRNTPDPELRRRIQAELIGRNDISELADVREALLADTLSESQKAVVLYEIGQRLRNQNALPALTQLLKSSDPKVRVASAQGLWHTASSPSVSALTEALNDESSEVRYYAIRGLADVNGQPRWGPSVAEYNEHEAMYRQHWLEWAKQNPSPRTFN